MDRAIPRIEGVIEVKQYAFAVRSHGRHLHVGSPRSSLIGLADETTHEVPWRFLLRHGDTSTRMHAHVSVTTARYVELELLFNNSCYAQGYDLQVS